ncbi:hypothetical protein ACJRO7_016022 [Eucalyptus globulus]|uniref:PGG domain-containing protein n=1 Tax=Eucalyptus globulus TaxID=34317 RepID=A0ABD3L5P7_EUCGL
MPSITSPRRTSPSPPSHRQASLAFERRQRERRLYEASHDGCVESLAQLLQEDRLILARASVTCFDETPLHVACMQGHVQFAQDLLAHKRDWAMELDSQGHTPLHWASANGYVEIARELLQSEPLACLVHDEDGWTPLHLATMKGRSNIVIELVKARPEAAEHRLRHGQTALHLGVSHNRLEALKVLVETVRDGDLVKAQDDEGNTILHLATANKQIETVKYLLQRSEVDMNTMNKNGFSALDIVEYFPKDFKVIELRELLVHAGALRAIRFPTSTTHQAVVDNRNEENSTVVVDLASVALPSTNTPPVKAVPPPSFSSKIKKQKGDKHEKWIKKKRDSLMIIATVIAAMAYQAGLSPPCGLWDNDQKDDKGTILYYAGTSILAANNPEGYPLFWLCNTVSFLASLSTIFLLMSGLPLGKKVLMRVLTGTMWVTITFMAMTYLESMMAISFVHREPKHVSPFTEEWYSEDGGSITVVMYSLFVWLGIVAIVFLVHTVRFLAFCWRNLSRRF